MTRIPALLLLAAFLLAPAVASASCADDVKELKARLEKVEKRDKTKAAAMRREMRPLASPLKPGESECRNIVVRSWRILNSNPEPICPPPVGAPYSQIEQCQALLRKRQQ
jgi:hypothetical protein